MQFVDTLSTQLPNVPLITVSGTEHYRMCGHASSVYKAWPKVMLLKGEVNSGCYTSSGYIDVISRSVGYL